MMTNTYHHKRWLRLLCTRSEIVIYELDESADHHWRHYRNHQFSNSIDSCLRHIEFIHGAHVLFSYSLTCLISQEVAYKFSQTSHFRSIRQETSLVKLFSSLWRFRGFCYIILSLKIPWFVGQSVCKDFVIQRDVSFHHEDHKKILLTFWWLTWKLS